MTLLTLLAALLWEHLRPLRDPAPPGVLFGRYVEWLARHINAGVEKHGLLAWVAAVLLPAAGAAFVGALLGDLLWPLEWAWAVLVLYFCMGFKQFSFAAADLARAILRGDTQEAAEELAAWRSGPPPAAEEGAVSRAAIEAILLLSLSRLFGVLFWFILLGVFGALLYRLSGVCVERWQEEGAFTAWPLRILHWLDWLPARAAAFSFAIVGNFQDALESWRAQAGDGRDRSAGILLASAAGALGVCLGGSVDGEEPAPPRPEPGCGEAAGPEYLDGVVALIWRAVLLWVALLGLVWLGGL
jgi:adenosylcobinamide-phosphate synthase